MKTMTITGKSSLGLLLCLAGLLSFVVPAGARRMKRKIHPRASRAISFVEGSVFPAGPVGQGDWASAAKNRSR